MRSCVKATCKQSHQVANTLATYDSFAFELLNRTMVAAQSFDISSDAFQFLCNLSFLQSNVGGKFKPCKCGLQPSPLPVGLLGSERGAFGRPDFCILSGAASLRPQELLLLLSKLCFVHEVRRVVARNAGVDHIAESIPHIHAAWHFSARGVGG